MIIGDITSVVQCRRIPGGGGGWCASGLHARLAAAVHGVAGRATLSALTQRAAARRISVLVGVWLVAKYLQVGWGGREVAPSVATEERCPLANIYIVRAERGGPTAGLRRRLFLQDRRDGSRFWSGVAGARLRQDKSCGDCPEG